MSRGRQWQPTRFPREPASPTTKNQPWMKEQKYSLRLWLWNLDALCILQLLFADTLPWASHLPLQSQEKTNLQNYTKYLRESWKCDPSNNCRWSIVAGSPTQGQLFKRWEKEQKICRRTSSAVPAKKLCCTLLLLLQHKKQQRSCTKTCTAAALHWRDRITRALRGDRAAGGGHYKASTWKQSKKQWSWFLHEQREKAQKYRRQLYCDVLQFLQT